MIAIVPARGSPGLYFLHYQRVHINENRAKTACIRATLTWKYSMLEPGEIFRLTK